MYTDISLTFYRAGEDMQHLVEKYDIGLFPVWPVFIFIGLIVAVFVRNWLDGGRK